MWNQLWREVLASHLFDAAPPRQITTKAELEALPLAARSYMRFFGVAPGQPKRWSFRIGWTGQFRRSPDDPWMPIHAAQYDTRHPVARIFHMHAMMKHVLPITARDTYVEGHGHMLAKVARLFTVADGTGPELDEGELVTWLNDAVLFAPTMLLGPGARFSHVDDRRFGVAFTDRGRTVAGTVTTDDRGAPIDFETLHRHLEDPANPGHLIRGRWSTPIASWRRSGELWLPMGARAMWHLASGDFTYIEVEPIPDTLEYDVLPRIQEYAPPHDTPQITIR